MPLCARALAILDEMRRLDDAAMRDEHLCFSGGKPGRPLTNMAFLMLLRRMGRADLTAHGFRSTFAIGQASALSFRAK